MARRFERLDKALGRLVFRAFGLLFLLVASICAYAAWTHLADRQDSLVPTIMFAVIALAFGACVPYCFSRKRTFTEALDAMEDDVPDLARRDRRS